MNSLLLSLFVTACIVIVTAWSELNFLQPSTPSPAEREAEEYAVYRAILGRETERCIHSQTIAADSQPGPTELDPESFPGLDSELIKDYNQACLESIPLNQDLLGEQVTMLSSYVDWPCMFIQGFSRVGFNKRMDEALIYYERKAPPQALAGGGELIYLVKGEDGTWKIAWSQDTWIS